MLLVPVTEANETRIPDCRRLGLSELQVAAGRRGTSLLRWAARRPGGGGRGNITISSFVLQVNDEGLTAQAWGRTSRLPDSRAAAAGGAIPPVEESPGSTGTRCRLTAGGGDPRESATESKPPVQGWPA